MLAHGFEARREVGVGVGGAALSDREGQRLPVGRDVVADVARRLDGIAPEPSSATWRRVWSKLRPTVMASAAMVSTVMRPKRRNSTRCSGVAASLSAGPSQRRLQGLW
ncbi:hypothetical protein [Oleiharenicola sp. Vm1]|uniref:hypothetical protein n=1 Tax=Oleiharenicola sp. Vm1 TaxID=3398393 RepID=UPI0039F5BF1F